MQMPGDDMIPQDHDDVPPAAGPAADSPPAASPPADSPPAASPPADSPPAASPPVPTAEWHELWTHVYRLALESGDPGGDVLLADLQDEARNLLPLAGLLRRVIVIATTPS